MTTSLLTASPLDERFEFLSEGWYTAAQARLNTLARRHEADLSGLAFSISEAYTDAPPHLKAPGDAPAFTLKLHEGVFSLDRDFDPGADWVLQGDYQAALPVAQAVGAVSRARALREALHNYGADAIRIRDGELAGLAADIMQDLRDYLARRTLENRDIEHRARRQGLTDNIRELADLGYTVIPHVLSDAFVAELRAACREAAFSHRSGLNRTGRIDVAGLATHGRLFEEVIQVPKLRTVMETALGPGFILHSAACSVTRPGPGGVGLHTDYEGVGLLEPYPEYGMLGTSVFAFEDWDTEEVGPTWIIPGSHKLRRPPRGPNDTKKGGVPILMPKGSVTFFAHGVWHWQGLRTQPGERVTMHNTYTRACIRQSDDLSDLDAIVHRNSPVLSTLLGHDDHFGRTGHAGHDEARMHALQRNVTVELKRREHAV